MNLFAGTAFADSTSTQECSDSHHSNTGSGANNDDGYQSDCDESDQGGNGQESGPGLQTGKPCAGCVGNADDKNPPGQVPDGSDSNSGYECDGRDRPAVGQNGNGNHGVGDENPAHTGCNVGSTGGPGGPGGPVGSSGEVLGESETITSPPNAVLGEVLEAPPVNAAAPAAAVAGSTVLALTDVPEGQLAFTGVGVTKLALLGFVLLLAGLAMIRLSRRPSVVTEDEGSVEAVAQPVMVGTCNAHHRIPATCSDRRNRSVPRPRTAGIRARPPTRVRLRSPLPQEAKGARHSCRAPHLFAYGARVVDEMVSVSLR